MRKKNSLSTKQNQRLEALNYLKRSCDHRIYIILDYSIPRIRDYYPQYLLQCTAKIFLITKYRCF